MKSFKLFYTGPQESLQFIQTSILNEKVKSFTTITTDKIRKETIRLMKCNTIVTLPDWEKHETSIKLVEIARLTGIAVVSHISLKEHVNK